MPNRMLRDWTGSDKINSISVHAERFFVRLIMKVDDYGCFNADPRLLKANLYPLLLDAIREADLLRWMTECQKAGLIVLYESAGKKYLQIQDFRQRLDKARSKFPLPIVNDFPEVVNEFPAERETEIEVEKETETEKEKPAEPAGAALPFVSDVFKDAWETWKNYKKVHHKFTYKTIESENAALANLCKLAGGDEETALSIVEQSIAQGWKGFFELKNQRNGGNKQVASGSGRQPGGGEKLGTSEARINATRNF